MTTKRVRHSRSSSDGEMSERERESETGDVCGGDEGGGMKCQSKVGKWPKKYGVRDSKGER